MIKALIHIDQTDNWKMTLENAKNMMNYIEDNKEPYEIEIVANGNSVNGLLKADPKWEDSVRELADKHVVIAACMNSLQKLHIKKEELFDSVTIVPAGVIEIVRKQQDGFSYIKP